MNIVVLYAEKGKLSSLMQKDKIVPQLSFFPCKFFGTSIVYLVFHIYHVMLNPSAQNMHLCFDRKVYVH